MVWGSRFKLLAIALIVGVLLGLVITPQVRALAVPPTPTDIPVVDQTNTLSNDQKQNLAQRIAAEREKTTNQIAILMIPTLAGDSLEDYSIRVARTWGVGTKEKNNGVLLLVVKNDRVLRIEVGYGLEGALTDARSSRIIRDKITPRFKESNYYQGISDGLDSIILAIHNENDPGLKSDASVALSDGNVLEFIFWALLLIPMWLGAILARSKSWWGGGVIGVLAGAVIGVIFGFIFIGIGAIISLLVLGLLFDWAVSRNFHQRKAAGLRPSWWAGGGSGRSGGGFGGFGGGGFGGGGSSGSW